MRMRLVGQHCAVSSDGRNVVLVRVCDVSGKAQDLGNDRSAVSVTEGCTWWLNVVIKVQIRSWAFFAVVGLVVVNWQVIFCPAHGCLLRSG